MASSVARPDTTATSTRSDVPSREDQLVAAAGEVIGGPLGRYARLRRLPLCVGSPRDGTPVLAWAPIAAGLSLAACLLVALGVAQKNYCFTHGWNGDEVFWHACFSDLPHQLVSTPLATGSLPYTGGADSLLQPVGTGLLLWLLSMLVPGGGAGAQGPQWFVGMWAILAALLAVGLVVLTVLSSRRHPWFAAHVALCPLLITSALVAPDLFGVVLVSLGLWLWARRMPLAAGLAFGAALTARSYALVVLLAIGLVALRAGVWPAFARTAGAALLTWLAVVAVAAVAAGGVGGALEGYAAAFTGGAEYGSPWLLPHLAGAPLSLAGLTVLTLLGWVLALAAGIVLTLATRRRPAIAQVALVMLVVVLLTSRSVPVQASLWVVPLVALAGLSWRDHVVWVSTELAYFVAVWLYIGGLSEPDRALPAPWYAVFLLLRLAGLALLAWRAIDRARVEALRPAPTGRSTQDAAADPDDLAGPAAGRPDALVVSLR